MKKMLLVALGFIAGIISFWNFFKKIDVDGFLPYVRDLIVRKVTFVLYGEEHIRRRNPVHYQTYYGSPNMGPRYTDSKYYKERKVVARDS